MKRKNVKLNKIWDMRFPHNVLVQTDVYWYFKLNYLYNLLYIYFIILGHGGVPLWRNDVEWKESVDWPRTQLFPTTPAQYEHRQLQYSPFHAVWGLKTTLKTTFGYQMLNAYSHNHLGCWTPLRGIKVSSCKMGFTCFH